ncbi:MAG: hypothetical protein LBD97_10500, partial [Bifidobacteriaceae bacterium]|nr:hypothetical protein [Bifidobacteriaceae bacterium]
RAATAADLAALAGAQALIDGLTEAEACAAADRIAGEVGAEVTLCVSAEAGRLRVACAVAVDMGLLGRRTATAAAVAGPP